MNTNHPSDMDMSVDTPNTTSNTTTTDSTPPPPPGYTIFNWDQIRLLLLHPTTPTTPLDISLDPSHNPSIQPPLLTPSPWHPPPHQAIRHNPQEHFQQTFAHLLDTYMSLPKGEAFDDIIYLAKLRDLAQGCTSQLATCAHLLRHPPAPDTDMADVHLRKEFFEMLAQNLEVFIRGQEKIVEKLWTQSDWKREHDVLGGLRGLSMGGGGGGGGGGGSKQGDAPEERMEGVEDNQGKN
ncbi:hypothetical protein QBC41DRAFT_345935 [Cercophora samala]|uniref:Uncharacterized protein n=1 Tax=Cercophora samala TaxID=330535 RepID=A0AA39ZFA6_9PEZI|nr:hypothetical protein QBC41DRAFT_345935 [Cercophora samala]